METFIRDLLVKMQTLEVEHPYTTAPRGSNLPVCRLDLILHHFGKKNKNLPNVVSTMHQDYYFGLGRALHELYQKWFGITGRVLAGWECPKCHLQVFGWGPCYCGLCGCYMDHHEIEVDDRGFGGHIDLILNIHPNHPYETFLIILDFKFLSKPDKPLEWHYELQVNSYVTILRRMGLPIEGGALVYQHREDALNLNKIKIWPISVNEDAHDFFLEEVEAFRQYVADPAREDLLKGICATEQDMNANGCIWRHLCSSPACADLIHKFIQG